ncbi:MAG: formate--tetrahydrofolate ligase [Flavobacteriales bacterium]|jgi:formate--tetrahydrofolate ligase|nr:formate--tetrahydrofolate ligase [Flavobacteriales bacterium]NCG31148.1 formate--tetrahydrofolate ligase [Bacteroidota bacterium]MBT3962944.1 formate--tetrahydrofolate ligase [Flavobacteriales bacterium]MBT4705791.1 formate--tetrahydrofolate ligase [Flavobacteriales bacterium]MBT4930212.1 formate--tetrahydrofolate ligase [Flavobacteriales bacterium]
MTDLEIARQYTTKPIGEIAEKLNLPVDELEPYGHNKAKIPLHHINHDKVAQSKMILVTAISPTPAGEGKTTTSIGLAEGLNRIGKQTTVVLREPSLGPVFGIKGGATGGGYSQVLPMEDINLHFTGDFAAIEKAHNLLSALIDNNLQSKTRNLGIDARTVGWKRVMDMNDRALRKINVGLGGPTMGIPRETGFDITAASEIMAILCLSKDLEDLKTRMGNIFIGYTFDKKPVYAKDLNAQGAMAALMKDAIKPNLVQTLEGNPAIIHGGPFANIAQGTNSVIATKMGMSLSDYVVTEAGFGADLGAEKFLDIKCRAAGLSPRTVVIVATIRALKYHGGKPLKELNEPDAEAVQKGIVNLEKHLENVNQFGIPAVVAINKFTLDTDEEVQVVMDSCEKLGAKAVVSNVWGQGGEGAEELAHAVVERVDAFEGKFTPMYDLEDDIKTKVEKLATKVYGAANVEFIGKSNRDLKRIADLGLEGLPICMAKTQKSLSDNDKLIGRPTGFTLTVREIEIAAGAGFLVPITGTMMRMPGLPATPASENIDIDADGNISGLF